jgi:hypothetical protein
LSQVEVVVRLEHEGTDVGRFSFQDFFGCRYGAVAVSYGAARKRKAEPHSRIVAPLGQDTFECPDSGASVASPKRGGS